MRGDLFSKLGGLKGMGFIAAAFVMGLILIFLPVGKSTDDRGVSAFDSTEYIRVTEERLCGIISQIKGAGSVRVMITLESSPEQYYQRDTRRRNTDSATSASTETEETMVFEDRKPILVKEIFPEIKGVAVVCTGAKDSRIAEKIVGLVSCAMDISSARIYVTY